MTLMAELAGRVRQVAQLRQQLAASRAEAAALRRTMKELQGGGGGGGAGAVGVTRGSPVDESTRAAFEELQAKAAVLEVANARLTRDLVRSCQGFRVLGLVR